MSGPSPGQGGGYYQDPNAYYSQQSQYQQHYDSQQQSNMNTVFEEDEPVSSPELGRGDGQWSQGNYDYGQYQSQQDQYSYGGQEQQGYDYGESNTQQPPSQEQWDPPHYPGYIYDAASNSYLPDPNWQPSNEDQPTTASEDQSQVYGDGSQQYGGEYDQGYGNVNGGVQGEGQAEVGGESRAEEGEDPYANDPYQLPDDNEDPYAQSRTPSAQPPRHDQYASNSHEESSTASTDPYAQNQDPYGEQRQDYYSQDQYPQQTTEGHGDDQIDPYAADSNPYAEETEQDDPFGQNSQQADPFAQQQEQYETNEGQYEGQDGQYDQQEGYYQQGSESYGHDNESYEVQQSDPYAAPSSSEAQPHDPYATSDFSAHDRSTSQQPYPNDPYGQQSQDPYSQQQVSHDPYSPPPPQQHRAAPPPSSTPASDPQAANPAPPPAQRSIAKPAYAPSPQQQQYSSFASVYDAAAQSNSNEAPYDPYAPVPKQSRDRAYSGASNLSSRSRISHTQTPEKAQDPYGAQSGAYGTRSISQQQAQSSYDPYSPPPPANQSQPAPRSSKPQIQVQPAAVPASSSQSSNVLSPTLSSARLSAFSPPPRSTSAQSNVSSASRRNPPASTAPPPKTQAPPPSNASTTQAGPPPRGARGAVAPPRSTAPPQRGQQNAFDIPPPRDAAPTRTAPPQQASRQQPQPQPQPQSQSQQQRPPEQPSEPVQNAPPSRTAPPSAKAPAPVAPSRTHESQQSTSSSTSASSNYIPPPPASSAVRAPPSSQRKPPPFGGVLQPPARRAPHQRGASAFGSDSPYGALPTGPLTSAYEPAGSGVQQIKEEQEEEEMPEENGQEEAQQEEQPPSEFVPSWMQATSNAPPSRGPYQPPQPKSAVVPPTNKASVHPPSRAPAPPSSSNGIDSLSNALGQVSLDDRQSQDPRRQQPPASRPPPSQQQQQQQQQQGPPRQGGPPPPRNNGPPPRAQPPPPAVRAPAPDSRQPPPPPQFAPPPAGRQPPAQQQQRPQQPNRQQPPPRQPPVPQLHFEPPTGEREYRSNGPTRPPPPAGQGSRSTTPVPMMVVEETAEEEEQYEAEDQYARQQEQYGQHGAESQTTDDYAMDESSGYGDPSNAPTGATTPSTTYGGDWQADGYDYVSGTHSQQQYGQQQQQQQAYDPYAPRSQVSQPRGPYAAQNSYDQHAQQAEEEEDDSYTPSIPQQSTFGARSSPRKQMQQQQQQRPHPKVQVPSTGPPRGNSTDFYASYPSDPYAQSGASNAPASYGSSHADQQQAYDPYAAQRPDLSRQGSYANGPSEVADLGLEQRTAPLVSFGFGGRMIVVFPNGGRQSTSSAYDASNPYSVGAPQPEPSSGSTVHIRKLADILPPPSSLPFPGPIFLDGGKANAGKKRKEAFAWLAKRIDELEEEVKHARSHAGYGDANAERQQQVVETKLLLVKLVRIFVENEGKLVGTPTVDEAVRAILAPHSASTDETGQLPTADQLASVASHSSSTGSTTPFVTYGVSAANLDEMSSFLLRGERREAVKYALDHRMWAHAFIIASCVDTDCWKDVTVEFLRSELTPANGDASGGAAGREALRVAYSMFAGLGAESIEQFLPPRSLAPEHQNQLLPAAPIGGSLDSRVAADGALSEATLSKWRDTVGMIVANRTAGDSAALTALGDALASNGWIEAAHVCYLLSPQTSLVGGIGSLSSRISLIGSAPSPSTGIDLDSVKLTELVEFGCSLAPTVKGQEAFTGFPHLLAFRLYHASVLADTGNVPQALKYTEAVVNTLKLATRPSPFYHPTLVAQVKLLGERLGASPGQKETSSWIARKVPRPTVNSLWSTFEGGFNKFVSGEGEPTPQQLAAKAEVAKVANGQPVGPFSHFSAIAPDSNSGTLSRAQSTTDLTTGNNHLHAQPPVRPLSAAAPLPPSLASPQSNKPVHSPGPPPVKRAPFKTHHARSSSLGAFAGYDFNPTAPPPWQSYTPPAHRAKNGDEPGLTESPRSSTETSERPKPQFASVEDRFTEDDSGFISPMAQYTPSVSPTPGSNRAAPTQNLSHRRMTTAEELADLGIGNSKSKKPAFDTLDEELEAEEGGAPPPKRSDGPAPDSGSAAPSPKPDDKPGIKPSKSWLGGWFKREASPAQVGPGPVKANLGEQKTFYYDEKLKRWVNNTGKAGDETPPAIVPPPRASTASPSRAMRGSPRFGSPAPPVPPLPPQRSQTTGPPPLSRSATSSDLRSQSHAGEFKPPSRPPSAADGPGGAARAGGARRNKPKYVVVPP